MLYRALCADGIAGLQTVAERQHVYCRLPADPPVDIQTTSAAGFGAARPPSQPGPVAPDAASPLAVDTPTVRAVSDVQLVAKIYYNRGVALAEQQQFEPAERLLEISCRLDPADRLARQNQLACINNWALAECAAGQFGAASARLSHGLQLAPDYAPFWDNDLYVHHRWVRELCHAGAFAEALRVLETAHQRRPAVPLFDEGRRTVCLWWQRALLAEGKRDEAEAVARLARGVPDNHEPAAADGSGARP